MEAPKKIYSSPENSRKAGAATDVIDYDPDFMNPLFDTGELRVIEDVQAALGAEAGRLAGDLILELRKVEEQSGRS